MPPKNAMLIKARAKINWALNVLGQKPDGYHLLDMLNQRLALADDVRLNLAKGIHLSVTGMDNIPANQDNLAWKAAMLLKEHSRTSQGVHIRVHKRIPAGAGLGGGSADAAAVLLGLNRLWGLDLSLKALRELGKSLGADVPYCLAGGFARVGGIGEEITDLGKGPLLHLVLLKPPLSLSTKAVFQQRKGLPSTLPADIDRMIQALANQELNDLERFAVNQLQDAAISLCPDIKLAIADLVSVGAAFAQLSGAGSLVYGVFESEEKARQAHSFLNQKWDTSFCTRSIPS